ncbi:DHHW family protein [Tissierella sp. Yu-01]|uniref:DHHW family protein n=1 Tax=Tissierella sp. Yu-01 TaxID=3035694 RepID=UPI00240E8161|nr:DHHW family protein [Tissierella sp. Yu-01]WFA09295.1 DHHW family protein [Tissierella sp. Yu-01]
MQMNSKKRFITIQNILGMLPYLFILAMFILHLILPAKTFSKEEKRYLAQWPVFHMEDVLDGIYGTKVETYFSDQFPFRNFWIHIQKSSVPLNIYKDTGDPKYRSEIWIPVE